MSYQISLPAGWRSSYERAPFVVEHNLAGLECFSRSALEKLAASLPASNMESHAGDVAASLPEGKRADQSISPYEYVRSIEDRRVWVGMLGLADHEVYGTIAREILEPFGEKIRDVAPGMKQIDAFVFITSPHSMTPYHIDSEHSFLLQIEGRKEFVMYDKDDTQLLSAEQIEEFYTDTNVRRLELPDHLAARGKSIVLEPGQGLHVPVCAPHFVRTLDEVSISLSITYYSSFTNRRASLSRLNRRLRRLGLNPAPLGTRWDPAKLAACAAWRSLRQAFPLKHA